MGANTQRLLYDFPTGVTFLRSVTRVYFDHLMTGSCSLAFKNVEKRAPTSIRDALGKMMVLDHVRDLKIFYHSSSARRTR